MSLPERSGYSRTIDFRKGSAGAEPLATAVPDDERARLDEELDDSCQLDEGASGDPVPESGVLYRFPKVGAQWGEYRLLAELGRGAEGRVFLAEQLFLADRPVVLKITPCLGQEHLTLARLQHTHIVPLYAVQHDAVRNLRTLCMPYHGGDSLSHLLSRIEAMPVRERSGQDLLRALDQSETAPKPMLPVMVPARQFLARASYTQAACWLGACLADALQHAHARGLVHLDLKPSNVLLAADGQPLLLDFHQAQPPLDPSGPPPEWLGGTLDYVSPEQRRALEALQEGRPVPALVDGRSDIYSLGLLLYQFLTGTMPAVPAKRSRLRRLNPRVSLGLADIIHKCLAHDPRDRYPEAQALADDLRRQLGDQPLRGVPNRSLIERWRKWRRRRPHALARAVFVLLAGATIVLGLALARHRFQERRHEAQAALVEGREALDRSDHAGALRALERGLALAQSVPASGALSMALQDQLRSAQHGQLIHELHLLAERLRFVYGVETIPPEKLRPLEQHARAFWEKRARIIEAAQGAQSRAQGLQSLGFDESVRNDLLDLALCGADLRARLAAAPDREAALRESLCLLDEAETLLGPSAGLWRERQRHLEALGLKEKASALKKRVADSKPVSAWEHECLGRSLLQAGDLAAASAELQRSLDLLPGSFWSSFHLGVCAFRLKRYDDAAAHFHACVALAPRSPECFYNRALAQAARGRTQRALDDYSRALELDPALAPAAFNRGILHLRLKRYPQALRDFEEALRIGHEPATVHYHLARVYWEQKQFPTARDHLAQALRHNAGHAEARAFQEQLSRER